MDDWVFGVAVCKIDTGNSLRSSSPGYLSEYADNHNSTSIWQARMSMKRLVRLTPEFALPNEKISSGTQKTLSISSGIHSLKLIRTTPSLTASTL